MRLLEKKRKKRKDYLGSFYTLGMFNKEDAGDVEKNNEIFNMGTGTSSADTTTSDGCNPTAMSSGGVAEELEEDLEKVEDIENFIKSSCSNLRFYKDGKGNCPVIDFLDEQPPRVRNKITFDMTKLSALQHDAREPLVKYLGDGIYELRSKISSDITRIFYFFPIGKGLIVFTNGFVKKSQKTPVEEINRAKKIRDICSREGGQKYYEN